MSHEIFFQQDFRILITTASLHLLRIRLAFAKGGELSWPQGVEMPSGCIFAYKIVMKIRPDSFEDRRLSQGIIGHSGEM